MLWVVCGGGCGGSDVMVWEEKRAGIRSLESASKRPARTRNKKEMRYGPLPVLEPLLELLDLTLVAADIGEALRRILGRPELRQVFSVPERERAIFEEITCVS